MKPKNIPKHIQHSPSITHLLSLLLLSHNLHFFSSHLLLLQPTQQLLAHLHGCTQLAAQLVRLFRQGRAEHGSGGLGTLPLLQGGPQPLDLLVLLVVWLTPDSLQLQLLLPELHIQPLDLLGGGQGEHGSVCNVSSCGASYVLRLHTNTSTYKMHYSDYSY